ncbi:MAG: Rieske 2Fe-2S domain-containing protein, partial [Solirubrobacterales bacterium]|nr:Rieske 2Fe-2S domain-containing protein [Solirubrobacterales bacterium]
MPYSLPVTQVGPESPSGKLLRQAWQPVATSRSLGPGDAQPLRILGEEFTLYRGESGRAYVVGARCAHRYTWLHTGRVEADCIRCFYHGWKYDGSGQCVEQPAEKETFASKIRIPAAAVQEYAGLVFASEPQWRVVPEVRAIRTGLDIEVTAVREGVERKTYYRFPNLMHITMFLD